MDNVNELETAFEAACGILKSAEIKARRSRSAKNVKAFYAAEEAYILALAALTEARNAVERKAAQADAIAQIEALDAENARIAYENPTLF